MKTFGIKKFCLTALVGMCVSALPTFAQEEPVETETAESAVAAPAEEPSVEQAEEQAAEPVAEPAEEPVAEQPAATTPSSTSIFVQDPAVFHRRQAELQKLQADLGSANAGLASLLADADRIAKMNDQCASISINDVVGEDCWDFYQVELPEFEARYMQVTGEIRLGYMETTRGLEDRKKQIDACTDALYSLASSKEEFVNLDGGVFLEPLAKGFEANYNFTLQYEPKRQQRAFEIARKWGEICRGMVVRQDGEGFAPFFLERLARLNANLKENGSLAVYKVDTAKVPTLYIDIAQPVRSAYYLNGVKLFHSRISTGPAEQSNLRVAFEKGGVQVDGATIVTKFDGTPAKYKGSLQFAEKSAQLNGRWYWENQGKAEGIDFGPAYDADSLQYVKAEAAVAKSEEAAKEVENRRGAHPSLWAAVTGVAAFYANEAAYGYGLEEDDLFIMPDVAAAVRVKLGFGKNAEGFVAVGVGGMVGFAIGNELEKVYVAPLAQFELGYGMFGFRETAIIPIAGSGEEQWLQFRSGVFCTLGLFNVELGYSIITDVGNGAYVGLGLVF